MAGYQIEARVRDRISANPLALFLSKDFERYEKIGNKYVFPISSRPEPYRSSILEVAEGPMRLSAAMEMIFFALNQLPNELFKDLGCHPSFLFAGGFPYFNVPKIAPLIDGGQLVIEFPTRFDSKIRDLPNELKMVPVDFDFVDEDCQRTGNGRVNIILPKNEQGTDYLSLRIRQRLGRGGV